MMRIRAFIIILYFSLSAITCSAETNATIFISNFLQNEGLVNEINQHAIQQNILQQVMHEVKIL